MQREHKIIVKEEACIGCELCKKDCPANNIEIVAKKAQIKDQECIKCGHCVAICPKAAIRMTGFEEAPMELAEQPHVDPEELLLLLKARRTIRQFQAKEVPAEVIAQIIEAGRYTPSAKNAQDVGYIVLQKDKAKYEAVAVKFFRNIKPLVDKVLKGAKEVTIADDFFFKQAPVVILVVTKDEVSGSLAAANMALMAESLGLGVLYSGFFAAVANLSPTLRKAFQLKGKRKVVTTLVLGYPKVKYRRTAQKEAAITTYL